MRPGCWLTRWRLDGFSDEELAPGVRSSVERHLAGCSRCVAELAAIRRLRAALASSRESGIDPPEPVWDAFWPQVRTRLARPELLEPTRRRIWSGVPRPRYVVGPAVAAAALAVLAVVAPWREQGTGGRPAPDSVTPAPIALPDLALGSPGEVVIQSIETGDPESPVMVYSTPGSDMTVVWVFGLERTGT